MHNKIKSTGKFLGALVAGILIGQAFIGIGYAANVIPLDDNGRAFQFSLGVDGLTGASATNPVPVALYGGGSMIFLAAQGTTVGAIKATSGDLLHLNITNNVGGVAYLQLFDKSTGSVTPGTTAPKYVVGLTSSEQKTVDFSAGAHFGTAISVICSTLSQGSVTNSCDVSATYR